MNRSNKEAIIGLLLFVLYILSGITGYIVINLYFSYLVLIPLFSLFLLLGAIFVIYYYDVHKLDQPKQKSNRINVSWDFRSYNNLYDFNSEENETFQIHNRGEDSF